MANLSDILTNYQSVDTLDSVTDRGATTTNAITIGNLTSTGIDDNASSTAITIASGGDVTIDGTDASTSIASPAILNLKAGDANDEYSTLRFATSADGSIGYVGAKATTTGAYPNSVGNLQFGVQNGSSTVTAMTIDNTGNVGIGTTSPAHEFHIAGTEPNIRLESGGTPSALYGLEITNGSTVDGYFRSRGATGETQIGSGRSSGWGGHLTFYTDTAERMRIDSSGNVGIGETAPAAKMQITGTGDLLRLESTNAGTSGAQLDLIHFSASQANDDTVGTINFGGRDVSSNATQYASITGKAVDISNEWGELRFGIRVGSSSYYHNRVVINRNHMQVVGDVGNSYAATIMTTPQGGASNQTSGMGLKATFGSYPSDTTPRRAADIWGGFTGTWDTEFLAFGVGNDGSSNDAGSQTDEKMRLDASGGLRIGHTTNIFNSVEDERLTVKNTENGCVATFEATNVSGGFPILYLRSTDSGSSQNTVMFYRTNSLVGSITTSSSSTAYNTSSDYRLKENVVSLDNAMDRVKQLSTYRFNFIADPDTTVDGFLAHEVSSIVPEAVTGEHNEVNDSGDPVYQGIDQSKLVPLLTKAIQELEARVAALESN